MAFPVASWLFTYCFAFWLGGLTVSDTMRLFADCYTFWAVEHLATFIWAFNFAFWFFAFYITDGVSWFSAGSMAFRRFAYWVADSWAVRIVAFP